jgi:aspartyl-tRNA(Asn)/glutamyl-tRNA(Gln) amidotransferase subunit A
MDPTDIAGPAVERLRTSLEAIRAWDQHVNAMITVDEQGAILAAEAADRAARAGRSLGLLHGLPIVVKDNIDTAGVRTTYGSRFFAEHVPSEDAEVVRRLRAAGAVIVGKANLHEFAFGIRSTNALTGQVRNPWDVTRIPGGSSGGSAAAVATGMAAMALGTDTGASVRIPAALTGITGLRPTTGRVSNRGSFPLSPPHDVIGPMAPSVEAVALLFAVIAGHDSLDPHSRPREVGNFLPSLNRGIQGMRIGRPRNHYFENISGPVGAALEEALRTLSRLGARIVDIELPGARDVGDWFPVILISDARDVHARRIDDDPGQWDPQTLERMRVGARYTGADYAHALRLREQWGYTLRRAFRDVEVLASPTSPTVAPLIDDTRSLYEASRALSQNTVVGSSGGIPGLSLPCGFSEGLPIGLQLEADRWNESRALQAGWAYQSVTRWHEQQPMLP